MKPTLDKSYSPCSEGYSCVTTRYRDQQSPVDRGSVVRGIGVIGCHVDRVGLDPGESIVCQRRGELIFTAVFTSASGRSHRYRALG